MKITKYFLAGAPALFAVTLAFTPLVRAESGSGSTSTTTTKTETTEQPRTGETSQRTETENELKTENTSESSDESHDGAVAARRSELELKIQALKAENKARLTAARAKKCETHTTEVNNIIQKRSQQATNQLTVFTKISNQVQTFVKNKNLTVDNYDSLVAAINAKQAAVQAAIDTNSATKFECATASADQPMSIPRTTIEAVRSALQEYRTAIKNLIVSVKASAEKAHATTSTDGKVSQ